MPPKPTASKAPTAGKAPAGKAPATEKKEAGKKTAATSGDKKKRTKSRKETYSSYIYKGTRPPSTGLLRLRSSFDTKARLDLSTLMNTFTDASFSLEAGSPRHWYLQPCHVHPQLLRQR